MNNFYVYILRRPDKVDPFDESKFCPFYVGKGRKRRVNEHRQEATRLLEKPGRKPYRVRVVHKLWRINLDFKEDIFLKELTEEQALEVECFLIQKYGRINNRTGILANLTNGGEGVSGLVHSIETRKKRSESIKGKNNPNFGKKHSYETRIKISEAHKGMKYSKEACIKRSEALKGKPHTEGHRRKISEANRNRIYSAETRKKMSEAHKGKKLSEETRQKMRISRQKYLAQGGTIDNVHRTNI